VAMPRPKPRLAPVTSAVGPAIACSDITILLDPVDCLPLTGRPADIDQPGTRESPRAGRDQSAVLPGRRRQLVQGLRGGQRGVDSQQPGLLLAEQHGVDVAGPGGGRHPIRGGGGAAPRVPPPPAPLALPPPPPAPARCLA